MISYSESFTFDAINNQVLSSSKSYNLSVSLFHIVYKFFDIDLKQYNSAYFGIWFRFYPTIDKSINPPKISGTI